MDVSVVAAVGSFVVSERVLKPKATALFILGCILAYDLLTKTHDITALRVYRGPALLAFTFMMCAYSLRTWRRNGVACDELLFLPGTLHGHEHGIEGPLIEMPTQPPAPPKRQPSQKQPSESLSSTSAHKNTEADLAAGVVLTKAPSLVRNRRVSMDDDLSERGGSVSAISPTADDNHQPSRSTSVDDDQRSWDPNDRDEEEDNQMQGLLQRTSTHDQNGEGGDGSGAAESGPMQRLRENHPRLARLGTFFFFRPAATATPNAAYAPSGPAVFGAALDLSMPVLFNFHLFIEAYNMQGPNGSDTPAKILPLIFLSVLIVRTMVPPSRRLRFWGTLKFTFAAPLYHVRFRDEFIGDVLTSWIRPGQDLFFAFSYYVTVIYGTLSGKYGLTESGLMLEESWLLHNVIMPSFAILPLWLKFLQTLRQAYDSNKRWPHQGNSFKYLSATLVIIYAITHPESRQSAGWRLCFCLTLLYQIWWDVFMDWELFEFLPNSQLNEVSPEWSTNISSFRPTSVYLLNLQMYVVQPVLDQLQRIRAMTPGLRQIQLRQKRLYKTELFYWKILAFNVVARFAWMYCYIPAFHVTSSRTVLTSTSDVNSYWGVLLPVTEILRRTLWGFLFVERETIKMMDGDSKYSRTEMEEEESEGDEDADSKFGDRTFRTQLLPTWMDIQQQLAQNAAASRSPNREQLLRQAFVFELYVWAAAFVFLGCCAAI